ncbi:MAG: DNA-directed RNA polymerase subunit E'' [Candidatus Aenigmarchaeota archaeon]|nr:DNA-directed RNA polymerase subunit E'' [Candidatus Aenigmarchaeota archaeon]
MKDKVCKHCKLFVKGEVCPICNMNSFSRTWKGLIYIKDPQNSETAKLLGITVPGKYTLWVK